jgi:hypothetical protein
MHNFAIAVIGGVVATALWTALAEWRRKRKLRTALGWISGRYMVTLKSAQQPEPESITISVEEENTLKVKIENIAGGGRASGQIIIDERHPTSGRGFYYHHRGAERMFGFWDVQLKFPSSILVHTTYVDNEVFREVPKGYVWDRIVD